MSTLQRRTLWREGRSAWEAWARTVLEKKKALEEAGLWSVNWVGEGENEQTRAWLEESAVDFTGVEFGEKEADFSGFVFPGPADFQGAGFDWASFAGAQFATGARFSETQFRRGVSFAGAQFGGLTEFEGAVISSEADFEGARFLKQSSGPLAPSARFNRAVFKQKAEFRGAKFAGDVDFRKCQFIESARFDEAEFGGEGQFAGATFGGLVSFCKTRFGLRADFVQAQFARESRFGEAAFAGIASFDDARFAGEASFHNVKFAAESAFLAARFDSKARFDSARFSGRARFRLASFGAGALFKSAAFETDARFNDARFLADATFRETWFKGEACFEACRFGGPAHFSDCVFDGNAVFQSMTADAGFALAGSRFAAAPAFHEAGFRDAPRLDNITIADPLRRFRRWSRLAQKDPRPLLMRWMKTAQSPGMSSRYKSLRRLAADAHDRRCELDFFAEELRCRRFWLERPFGKGGARFWFGWAYGGISNFGRSMLRPFMAWTISVAAFALFYLRQRTGTTLLGALAHLEGPGWPPLPVAWNRGLHWLADLFVWAWRALCWGADGLASMFSASACVQGGSSPVGEAFYLSLKNGLVMVHWGSDQAARRTYGCLYGLDGGAPVEPLATSLASLAQAVMSAALIFLFLLALRNLLKVK
jgi:hypothetical protein